MIEIRYFARLREQLETESEQLEAGPEIRDLTDIMRLLMARGGSWADLFAGDQPVLMAVNQEVANAQTPVKDGDEVAFFPPVTGG